MAERESGQSRSPRPFPLVSAFSFGWASGWRRVSDVPGAKDRLASHLSTAYHRIAAFYGKLKRRYKDYFCRLLRTLEGFKVHKTQCRPRFYRRGRLDSSFSIVFSFSVSVSLAVFAAFPACGLFSHRILVACCGCCRRRGCRNIGSFNSGDPLR